MATTWKDYVQEINVWEDLCDSFQHYPDVTVDKLDSIARCFNPRVANRCVFKNCTVNFNKNFPQHAARHHNVRRATCSTPNKSYYCAHCSLFAKRISLYITYFTNQISTMPDILS